MAIFHVGQRLADGVNVDVMVERVASGGYGEVAMGPNQRNNGTWLALKTLRPDLLARLGYQPDSAAYQSAEARLHASFLHEALVWRGLWPHRNLLKADGVTEINGQLMLILDYAEPGDLRKLFIQARRRNTWIPLEVALHLAQQIATGLAVLHTPAPDFFRPYPIVHRDLKPENILLNQVWARITDFGLAKAAIDATSASVQTTSLDGEDAPTRPFRLSTTSRVPIVATLAQAYSTQRGQILGTPAYMAPEQWLDAARAGPPADAYAFGLIVAELLTGRHPLLSLDQPHSLADWQVAHEAEPVIPLSQLGADIFANQRAVQSADAMARQEAALVQVEGLVARLLAKQEAARPTLGEVLAELRTAAVTLGKEPYTPSEVYPPTEQHQAIFWQGWAQAYYHFELQPEALRRIEQALALAPHHWAVLSTYANILGKLGRRKEALVVHEQALAQLPVDDYLNRAVIWSNTGDCLNKLECYAEAEEAFAEAIQLAPADARTWAALASNALEWAQTEQASGQVEAARARAESGVAHIAQAVRLNPDHPSYPRLRQELLQLQDRLRRQV